jgi:hypothetical protein
MVTSTQITHVEQLKTATGEAISQTSVEAQQLERRPGLDPA